MDFSPRRLSTAAVFFGGAAARRVIDNSSVILRRGSGKNAVVAPEMAAPAKPRRGFETHGYPRAVATRLPSTWSRVATLQRFVGDQRLPMHNNLSERALRRQAAGRKNWLFVGSAEGARANTTFVSLLASCAMHRIEPWAHLRDRLCLLPTWPVHRVIELAPACWQATIADPSVRQRLDANLFRRVTLVEHRRAAA